MTQENYVGKVVLVEAISDTKRYRNGEYVILEQSETSLFGVSMKGGYDAHAMETLAFSDYKVVRARFEPDAVATLAERVRHYAETPDRGEKLYSIQSTYDSAHRIADLLEEQVDENGVELQMALVIDTLDNGDVEYNVITFYA